MNYPIRLTVCALLLSVSRLSAATHYVSLRSGHPKPPYTNWLTAATSIQGAVDASKAGDTVLVTNGLYHVGQRDVGQGPSRVAITNSIALLSVNGPQFTVIDGGGIYGSLANRCVSLADGASLSGFTLTNGGATNGGGVWCASANVFLTNCTLSGNSAAAYGFGSDGYGGGAYGGTLYNCTLTGNEAQSGGGAYGATLTNCTLTGNWAWVDVAHVGGYGGGAYGGTLCNCTLSGNTAFPDKWPNQGFGGGAYGATLTNCTLTGNSAPFGGGAYGGTLYNCTLSSNSALPYGGSPLGGFGGGAYGGTLCNCALTGNSALFAGGAYGGTLNNCTLTGNGGLGGAYGGGGVWEGTLYNCILYFNTIGTITNGAGANYDSCTLNCCCTTPMPTNGVGNITGDPLFLDYTNGNLRLPPSSPCINAGDVAYVTTTTDLDGDPRIVNGMVDMGAYEFQGPRSGPPFFVSQPASLTNEAHTTAAFSALAGGSAPLSYQWLNEGVPLADGRNIAGSRTAVLTLTNVLGADAGGYSVVVSNGFGSVTSAVATLAVIDPVIVVQPVSQVGQSGQSVTLSVTAAGTAPFGYQWWMNGAALAWDTGASLTLTNLQATDAGGYSVVVSNQYGSVTSAVALLTVNLATLDSGFNPGAEYGVSSLAVQADGKILVGGDFTTLAGQPRNNLGRLNADGTLDSGFNPGAYWGVNSLAVQADGKILVGGGFTTLGGQTRSSLGRLNADGTLDSGFNPGADWAVDSLALHADGKILVGGSFSTLGGRPRNNLGRLNPDGSQDSGFNPGANNGVYSLALQADGKILVGGDFTDLGGKTRNYIGRLNANGTLDSAFNPGADGSVYSLAVQADGKILVGGWFSTLGGRPCNSIGRLKPDGTLDSAFSPGADGSVDSLAVQADGKILVGGGFTNLGGKPRNNLGRLNADGTVDSGFNPGPGGGVACLALQADGKILVGGGFTSLCGQPCSYLGRLNNTEPATQSLSFDGSTITWLRGGASTEVCRTTFDFSTNGAKWASLGAGARTAGGWHLTRVSLPSARGALRARGYLDTWFVETELVVGARPVILVNDPSFGFSSNRFGFKFSGGAGQVAIVETSTDLASWTPVATNTLAATPSYFAEPYSAACPQRFYRLRVGP